MIKKVIACLTICFIITGIISPVFSDASALPQPNWTDPGISEIINISDLTGWIMNGGTYDVSTYTDAESFMNDYFAARTKTRLEGSDYQVKSSFGLEQQYYQAGDSAYAHPLDVNRVISSSFRDHSGYGRRFSNEVKEALLSSGHLYDTKIPLLNEIEFANFVGYNHDALKIYASSFVDPDAPNPQPGPDFSFLSEINKVYLGNFDLVTQWDEKAWMLQNKPNRELTVNPSLCSFYTDGTIKHAPNNTAQYYYDRLMFYNGILTINYDTESNTCIYTGNGWPTTIMVGETGYCLNNFRLNTYLGNQVYIANTCSVPASMYVNFQTNFAGLSTAINYFFGHFGNINLYVDNELWAYAGYSAPPITPEFPDAVGGEDLPTTTWPVHRPLAPYFITSPGMLQAIQDAIDDDGKLDIDDLKPYLTDENGDPVPDPQFDPEPIPIPVPDPVNPDVVPGLPVLPAIPPDMPGFNGVSVLAEIINFTNQSLPTSLIVTFWGIIFGIVILGLIKILHK